MKKVIFLITTFLFASIATAENYAVYNAKEGQLKFIFSPF